MTDTTKHQPSAVDAVAEAHMRETLKQSPEFATISGLGTDPESARHLDDYSPAGIAARAELARATLAQLDTVTPTDDVDRVTIAAMRERLGVQLDYVETGEELRTLNNIASPVQSLRDHFDLVDTDTVQDWDNIASVLSEVPRALAQYQECLRASAADGQVAALRQVQAVVEQCRDQANPEKSSYSMLVSGAKADDGELPAVLQSALRANAERANAAYGELADFLDKELAPQASAVDGVGRERYELFSRDFLGARIDFDETYEWGRERLAAIDAEQRQIAADLYGAGTSVQEALEKLNADPQRMVHGTDALQQWMQETSDAAVATLDGVHFDIPEELRTLECCIAPSQTGGIYYTGPADDFSRPGRMWWSVPEGTTDFATWQERTTVFHEGVPGHHLQVGLQTYHKDLLNSWRRHLCWVSGHGEGWALYAERLMADLGFQDDPGDRMGMLDSQRLRAARVVLDIGVHLGKERPAELAALPGVGAGKWDRDSAWEFLKHNVAMDRSFLAFELNRYLGWPGQAPSYAVGQRLWEEARDATRAATVARGEEFSLKDFHMRALSLGSVGLDVLREALVG